MTARDDALLPALLGFLQAAPLHGYEIHQRLQQAQALGLVWHLKQAQLYALLSKLEADGLIDAETIAQAGRPAKRLLRLTPAGAATFAHWIVTPVARARDLRIVFLAKLFWAQAHSAATAQQLIVAQRAACAGWLAQIDAATPAADERFRWLVQQFRRGQIEAMLAWLDTCATTLAPRLEHA
jgi:PadR family transcriptional regulator, regulatory protein AphA